MWDDLAEEEDDDEEEDEGLAGQLLSDLIASNKYGKNEFDQCGLKLAFSILILHVCVWLHPK